MKMNNSNERLFNAIFQNINPNSIEYGNCDNCLCCMNKQFNPFCFEKNTCVELDSTCDNWEKERN